jgi:hypothetical protein
MRESPLAGKFVQPSLTWFPPFAHRHPQGKLRLSASGCLKLLKFFQTLTIMHCPSDNEPSSEPELMFAHIMRLILNRMRELRFRPHRLLLFCSRRWVG